MQVHDFISIEFLVKQLVFKSKKHNYNFKLQKPNHQTFESGHLLVKYTSFRFLNFTQFRREKIVACCFIGGDNLNKNKM